MLEAGGIPLYYDSDKSEEWWENGTQFVNYNSILRETSKLNQLHDGDSAWMEDCKGKAVKILTPAKVRIPKGPAYRFIWMDRKAKHCVKSNRKWMRLGARDSRSPKADLSSLDRSATDDEMMEYFKDQRLRGLRMLRSYPDSRLIIVRFEAMIKKPYVIAGKIRRFLKIHYADQDVMGGIVVKRSAHCMPTMMEEEIYA
jgi:hypothetical protein